MLQSGQKISDKIRKYYHNMHIFFSNSPVYAQIWHCICAILSPSSKLLKVACLAIFSQTNSVVHTERTEKTWIMLHFHTHILFSVSIRIRCCLHGFKQPIGPVLCKGAKLCSS